MTHRKKAIIALFILAVVFASFGIFSRYLNTNFSVFQQLYIRVFLALIISIAIFYKDLNIKSFFNLPKKEWAVLVFRAFCFYGLAVPLNVYAIVEAKYSNVTFLQAIPITALLGFLFLQERLTSKKLFIIFFAFIGVLFVAVKDVNNLSVWGRARFWRW